LLGADLFDAHFADMDISGKFSPTSPLRKVLREKRMGNIDGDIQKGDWIYITNIPEYKERHPFGNAPGWNLICVSDDRQQYVGFGLSDSSDGTHGKSIDEIKTILVDEYKKPPKMEFTSSSSTSRGRSGSFGSQMDTKKSVKYSDAQEAVESASKMIGGLKKQSMSFSSITEPYFEPDSKRYRISSAKLNQIIQGGI
jgi:hypothetical protein